MEVPTKDNSESKNNKGGDEKPNKKKKNKNKGRILSFVLCI